MLFIIVVLKNFANFAEKISMLEYLFNKVAGPKAFFYKTPPVVTSVRTPPVVASLKFGNY